MRPQRYRDFGKKAVLIMIVSLLRKVSISLADYGKASLQKEQYLRQIFTKRKEYKDKALHYAPCLLSLPPHKKINVTLHPTEVLK